jgi:serine/threonine-protein kinase
VFALGVVLYNALTGLRLFEAATMEETLRQVCTFRIDPPSTVGLRPPPSLDFACMKALERDPSRRYESAEEMMMELRRIALREHLLAPASEVAAWVREAVGRELVQRRLSVLDAARGLGGAGSLAHDPISSPPESAPGPRDDAAVVGDGPPSFQRSQTIVLPSESSPGRRIALIVASVLAGAAIIATMVWPDLISRAFSINTEGVPAKQIELSPALSAQGLTPVPTMAPAIDSAQAPAQMEQK